MDFEAHTQELSKKILSSKSTLLTLKEKILLSVYISEMNVKGYSAIKPLTIFITEYNKQLAAHGLKQVGSERTLQRHRDKLAQFIKVKSQGKSVSITSVDLDAIKQALPVDYKAALDASYTRYNKVKYRNAAKKNVAKVIIKPKTDKTPVMARVEALGSKAKSVVSSLGHNNSNELKKNIYTSDPKFQKAIGQERKAKLYNNKATPSEVIESLCAFELLGWNWVYPQYCKQSGRLMWGEVPRSRNHALDRELEHIKQAEQFKNYQAPIVHFDDLDDLQMAINAAKQENYVF